MSQKLVECVPNFSEGRRTELIDALADGAGWLAGTRGQEPDSSSRHLLPPGN